MKLPVYLYGHPVLRATSNEIGPDYPELKQFVADMWETMYNSDGCGLAAPQVGRNDRIVVIDADLFGEDFPECKGRKFALINPKIEVLEGETVTRSEGCLSLPDLSESVPRVENIRLTWVDEDFQPHEEVMTGFLSRIVQHECDHLEGKLYIDHVSPIRRQLLRSKLSAIIAGRKRVHYPVRYAPQPKGRK